MMQCAPVQMARGGKEGDQEENLCGGDEDAAVYHEMHERFEEGRGPRVASGKDRNDVFNGQALDAPSDSGVG